MSRARARAIVLAASATCLAFGIALACGPGSLGDLTGGRPDSGAPDATADAPVDAGCAGQMRGLPPVRPEIADDGMSIPDQYGLTFAFDDMRVDTGDFDASLGKPQSFDLDHACTCPEPSSCVPPDAGASLCDTAGGRDNVAGGLIAGIASIVPGLTPALLQRRIHDGAFNFLVHVAGWNGKPDDPIVGVDIKGASKWDAPRDDAGALVLDDAGKPLKPAFDGTDIWDVDPQSIVNSSVTDCQTSACVPRVIDPMAYVAGGVVVAHFDSLPVNLVSDTGAFFVQFVGVTFSARITPTTIAGEMAGRWPVDSLLSTARGIRDPITDAGICPGSTTFMIFKQTICAAVDLAVTPTLDNTGASCNALSESMAFTGVLAKAGPVQAITIEPSGCPDTDAGQSCANDNQ
ncbi:MAG TPA: hypothetical protein VIF62_18715 [Labilithrix sp.]|jgi:hypothetical protein